MPDEKGAILLSTANAVGAILNKKMGVNTGFAPADWRDTINLLGKLPEKTASGAIASFADGADGVPVKSCVVSFTPSGGGGTPQNPISVQGVSGLSVTRTGKNLYDFDGKEYNVPFHDASGNVVQYADCATNIIKVNASTQYSFSITKETSRTVNVRIVYLQADGTFISRDGLYSDSQFPRTITTPNNCGYLEITINQYSTAQISQNEWKLQIERGSSPTTYSAYISSVVTDTFGQTIYGGTRDLVTDKASVTYSEPVQFDGTETWSLYSNTFFYTTKANTNIKGNQHYYATNGIDLTYNSANGQICVYISNNSQYIDTTTNMQTFMSGQAFCYELATPTEITGLTPHNINTLLGDNNFYADTGDSEITYRADIELTLAQNSGTRMLQSIRMPEIIQGTEEPEEAAQEIEEQEETR